jgi:L-alanine-DL-glutamate epimerase-like enolase superfamily enzyme
MLEQPCATHGGLRRRARATGLPMKLDELAHDTGLPAGRAPAGLHGCRRAEAVEIRRALGAARARDLCLHLGAKMCIEDTWGSDIAMAAALHLGAATDPAAF